jgi:hypothetical protein
MTSNVLTGTPTEQLPAVLATGATDVQFVFVSMSGRQPDGRDAEYLEWHALDHRPEQYRLAGLRHSLRLVSTPACRAERAASQPPYDDVDYVMSYLFSDRAALGPFGQLSKALTGDRRPVSIPRIEYGIYDLVGKVASPRAICGADVIPWRPALGVYLLIERGAAPAERLIEVDGVAGVWWHEGQVAESPFPADRRGLQITYCYLDQDPVAVAPQLRRHLDQRWSVHDLQPMLAAPFHTVVPFDWGRHVP